MRIVAVSFNRPDKNKAWSLAQGYPFEVWSDVDKTLALTFGAVSTRWTPFPSRITVLLNAEGQVILEYRDGIDVGTHPGDVLDDCRVKLGPPAGGNP